MSESFKYFSANSSIYQNPSVEITPAHVPIIREIKGDTIISADEPIITPPARVAFKIYSMFILPLNKNMLQIIPEKEAQTIEYIVFTADQCFVFPTPRALLNEGQYIHKNIVPMKANRFE